MTAFISELPIVLWWYFILLLIGLIFIPITSRVFSPFIDRGYAFSKILGIVLIGYTVWILASFQIFSFSHLTVFGVVIVSVIVNFLLVKTPSYSKKEKQSRIQAAFSKLGLPSNIRSIRVILFEEALFLFGLLAWVYVRGHEPSIHGLEKFMDFGFINIILNSTSFPPQDMWLAPEQNPESYTGGFFINYYYFGHYITALLTKLTSISPAITYNLMLSSIFAFTLSATFSIAYNLLDKTIKKAKSTVIPLIGGFITAVTLTIGGNLHAIYLFTKGYENEKPVPFWQIWGPSINEATGEIVTNYWYPNATRFIPNTIHEFPSYSWVVADLHGHVLDIPFVLLTIGLLYSIFTKAFSKDGTTRSTLNVLSLKISWPFAFEPWNLVLLGLLTAVMYMTNAWDGLIYLGTSVLVLTMIVVGVEARKKKPQLANIISWKLLAIVGTVVMCFVIFSFPFNRTFKPFVHGVGIVGGYELAGELGFADKLPEQPMEGGGTNSDVLTFGPFLLEKGNNLSSPFWMMSVLWGFFLINSLLFMLYVIRTNKSLSGKKYGLLLGTIALLAFSAIFFENSTMSIAPVVSALAAVLFVFLFIALVVALLFSSIYTSVTIPFLLILILVSTGLILVPEILYAKDIYPGHYRANTLFKLGYQAFMMFSIVSGYTIVMLAKLTRSEKKLSRKRILYTVLFVFDIVLLGFVLVYPYFSINSYYGTFKIRPQGSRSYESIDGTGWMANSHPDDFKAIQWFNNESMSQCNNAAMDRCIILEAVGESYTDYARISVHTGLATVLGWPVHEWLWRGSYNEPGTRVEQVRKMYESTDPAEVESLLEQFNIDFIIVGSLEREKYPNLNEQLLTSFGEKVFESGSTAVYAVK